MGIEKKGNNCIISVESQIGNHVIIGHNVIIEENVIIGDDVFIDNNTVIRAGTRIGNNCTICSNCILGEYQMDFIQDRMYHEHLLTIGDSAIIRSNSVLYSGSCIGENFQTGHHVTIREKACIGDNCSIGTLSDIQGHCKLGNFVRLHSNAHIGMSTVVDDFVWIYPYVVFTNDPTPPSDTEIGVHVHSFAVIATSATILPGLNIESDSLVAAGATVTKDVLQYSVVGGSPARRIADIREIKSRETGQLYYPWRYNFSRNMPWKENGFIKWLEALSPEDKEKFGLL